MVSVKSSERIDQTIKTGHILIASIFLLAIAARVIPGPRTIDDAYITFRYARNILTGNGFVFNPGEAVLGTTTPLYTILMVALGSITGGMAAPFEGLALGINAIADAIGCVILISIATRLGYKRAGIAAGMIWAIAPFSVTFAIGGMETSVFILLLLAGASFYLDCRFRQCWFVCALALLTRPDALIFIGLFAIDRLWRARSHLFDRELWVEISIFIIPVLPWLIFASLYFGSILPHSILAKTVAYHLSSDSGLIRLMQHYATPFLDQLTFGNLAIPIGLILYPFLAVSGFLAAVRKNARIWPFLVYPWVYLVVFSLANPLLFRWYLTPPLPAYLLAILVGADHILKLVAGSVLRHLPGNLTHFRKHTAGYLGALLIIPIILTAHGWVLHPDHGINRPTPEMAWYQLELLYRDVANELVPELKPGDVICAGDVGVLGFVTKAKILDTVGLNSALAPDYYPLDETVYVINYAIPTQLVLDQKPDYVVFLEVYGRRTLLQDNNFLQQYHLITKLPTDIYGSNGMLVYQRKASQLTWFDQTRDRGYNFTHSISDQLVHQPKSIQGKS